jgi:AcrR family transcriptional regulator
MGTKASIPTGDARRLDVDAWVDAALDLLAKNGIDGVRVEILAKTLQVTKGSFYWHFNDRDALHEHMLETWRRRATLALIERLNRGDASPEARLRRLLRLPLTGDRSALAAAVELAIRLWGRRDERARIALREVDELRLRYIAGLIEAYGSNPQEADARAILAYSYMRVAPTLIEIDAKETMDQCEMIILGTRQAVQTAKIPAAT